jgi:hypothetical protein
MKKVLFGLCALAITMFTGSNESGAQGGTAPQSQSMGASRSGSAIDPDPGTTATKNQFDERFTGQAPGIGEKGSGQGQSTMERSEGKQGSPKERAQSSDPSKGKNAQAREQPAHDEHNR